MRHLREVLPIEQSAYPKPWSRSVFESEFDQVASGSRYYVVARDRTRGDASSGTPVCGSCPTPTATRRT